ncbi:MAG: MlaD family protein [Actinobacteria bacterium]|nr:MlaD family protein [Actinomycetota bacterium]
MRNSRLIGRIVALAAVIVAVAVVATILLGSGSGSYEVKALFQNASQLVKGNLVQVSGTPVGKVTDIALTDDGQAQVTFKITEPGFKPLREGTLATVRQASLSGIANRYIDLQLPPNDVKAKIPDGGLIRQDKTVTAVDLDQLFNTFDPRTRKALSTLIRGYSTAYGGRGRQANQGWQYLNPSLAASSRLFSELNYDTPLLKRFIVSSSKLVSDLAQRRSDLSGLVDNLATAFGAIGRQKAALADAISQLPPFMRRANTTFVNLRATLDDLDPLVNESKPVAPRLRRFLAELRPLARDARPTLRDLVAIIKRNGSNNDLIELTRSAVPLRDIAVGPVNANGKQREGAFPASTKALHEGTPELGYAKYYAPDLTGWFDDFSHTGMYDALGGFSRAAPNVNAFAAVNGLLQPIPPELRAAAFSSTASLDQRDRCPGAIERGAAYKPSAGYECNASQVPLGP